MSLDTVRFACHSPMLRTFPTFNRVAGLLSSRAAFSPDMD